MIEGSIARPFSFDLICQDMVTSMHNATGSRRRAVFIAILVGLIASGPFAATTRRTLACGGCDPMKETLAEEIAQSAAAVICRLVARPDAAAVEKGAAPECTFEVTESLKGTVAAKQRIKILYAGEEPLGSAFYARAEGAPDLVWYHPTSIGPRETDYLRKLGTRPAAGPERLLITYDYLEAPEPLLAADAYEEFARASYAHVAATKARMPREKLLKWIADVNVQSAHRKQYLYMLAVCGTTDDQPQIEALMRRGDPATSRILDAVIGCYLVMRGAEGLPLVEQLFLTDPKAEQVDTLAAISALRFTAVESRAIPRERVDASFRLLLERPEVADLIVPDLIRSRDWTITVRVAKLFREAEKNNLKFARVPIAGYFLYCPTPEAAALRKELETLDAEAFARAKTMYGEPAPEASTGEQAGQ